jgi:hypothetical protein
MAISSDGTIEQAAQPLAERLNRQCICITLDRVALFKALEHELGNKDFSTEFFASRPHLFANASVFLSQSETDAMHATVRAIEAAAVLPGYRHAVLSGARAIAYLDFGPVGVLMGYDFHLSAESPKLMEVNTNAGGSFLNALLAKAQRACCKEVALALNRSETDGFESAVLRAFQNEWALQKRSGILRRIAILDDQPEEQYLYPEFILAQRIFEKHGIEAVILDPGQLLYQGGRLLTQDQPIDLVYNRLVDFAFERPEHEVLRDAYLDGAVVVTPNPRVHALYADKRNLVLLSDQNLLRLWGLSEEMLADLAGVPQTVLVTPDNAQQLWKTRKSNFFKPFGGHGGKAVYRGDKLTKGVWAEIIRGGYVAQEFAAPSERKIELDGLSQLRKTDVRLYTYGGQVLLTAARLYQGQTTNFRTPGGGFAPAFTL